MKRKCTIGILGLFAALIMLFCAPVYADEANTVWTQVDNMLINEKDVYTDGSGNLSFKEDDVYRNIAGLSWNEEDCMLTMNDAVLKSFKYTNEEEQLYLNLKGDNVIKYFGESKNNLLFVNDLRISGNGNLDVVLGNVTSAEKTYAIEADSLILGDEYTGTVTVNNWDKDGSSLLAADRLIIGGGHLWTNSTIEAAELDVDYAELTVNIKQFAKYAIYMPYGGSCSLDSGSINIINKKTGENGWNGRGIQSNADLRLNGSILNIESNGEAVSADEIILNGSKVNAKSYCSDAFVSNDFEAVEGLATLTAADKFCAAKTVNKPEIDNYMLITKPERGVFASYDQSEYKYAVLDANKNIASKAVFKKAKPVQYELLTAKAYGKKAIKLSWNEYSSANKYVLYGQRCGKKYRKLTTIRVPEEEYYDTFNHVVKKINGAKLIPHKMYKFYVVAYDNNKKVAKSKTIFFITANTCGKYGNTTNIKVSPSKKTLTVGQTLKLNVTTKTYKNKKHLGGRSVKAFKYSSECPQIASVNSKGIVKALAPGKTCIHVQDKNGKHCTFVITVKSLFS